MVKDFINYNYIRDVILAYTQCTSQTWKKRNASFNQALELLPPSLRRNGAVEGFLMLRVCQKISVVVQDMLFPSLFSLFPQFFLKPFPFSFLQGTESPNARLFQNTGFPQISLSLFHSTMGSREVLGWRWGQNASAQLVHSTVHMFGFQWLIPISAGRREATHM